MRPAGRGSAARAVAAARAPAPAPLVLTRRYPRPVLIKAHLKGHEFDLINLAELFREGEAAVAADIEGYDLSFTAPEELFHQAARLYDAASVVLRRANAIGRVLTDEFRPVGLTGRFSDETGQQHQVALADSAEVRSRAFVAVATQGDQPPAPAPTTAKPRLRAAGRGPPRCCRDPGHPRKGWPSARLDGAIQGVRDHQRHAKGCVKRGWLTRDQVSVFRGSANRNEVSGELARHARLKGDPLDSSECVCPGQLQFESPATSALFSNYATSVRNIPLRPKGQWRAAFRSRGDRNGMVTSEDPRSAAGSVRQPQPDGQSGHQAADTSQWTRA
jgi:hypothetical protein